MPWKVGATTETPIIDKFLGEWLNQKGLPEKDINTLKDIFAFALPTKYFIKVIFFLHGSGNDGKSQFIKTMIRFVGKDNSTATTLAYLENC